MRTGWKQPKARMRCVKCVRRAAGMCEDLTVCVFCAWQNGRMFLRRLTESTALEIGDCFVESIESNAKLCQKGWGDGRISDDIAGVGLWIFKF